MELTSRRWLRHAGSETVLAVFDIGELSFLLLVRMSPAEQAKLAFVERRGDFTERVYEGRTYRAKIDPMPIWRSFFTNRTICSWSPIAWI
jgi:hypothetical protein